LCDFLELERDSDHLEACASVVYERPNRSRERAAWTPELVAEVEEHMTSYPFLDGYRFHEPDGNR
jgi:hypothetical protein